MHPVRYEGKYGKNCWESKADVRFRPKNWTSNKGKTEVAASTVVSIDYLLGVVEGISVEEPRCVLCA